MKNSNIIELYTVDMAGFDPVPVLQVQGEKAFFFKSRFNIDADGSPKAYHPDPNNEEALDYKANMYGLTDPKTGKSAIQKFGEGNGFYVSPTSLADGTKDEFDQARYVDASRIPYIVLPGGTSYRHADNAKLGDFAAVYSLRTKQLAYAIYADSGPSDEIGEGSIQLADDLGFYEQSQSRNAKRGGEDRLEVIYIVFPESRKKPAWPVSIDEIRSVAGQLFEDWGGISRLKMLFPNDELNQKEVNSMTGMLKKDDQGAEVTELQKLLVAKNYLTDRDIDGIFGNVTYKAIRLFQSKNLDQHGRPLVVDGKVGPLTWWSLTHDKPYIETPSAIDYTQMPPIGTGGSKIGREALAIAIKELKAKAGEVGGNNCGPFVKKYLNGIVPEGNPWCAGFVSFCFSQVSSGMPFPYTVGAQNMLKEFKDKGWVPNSDYLPQPGDIVVWSRDQPSSGLGHVGLVHQYKDGMLYTIEGNRSPRVQGFSYVFSQMKDQKLLGFGHVPDM